MSSKLRVLVVDDSAAIRKILQRVLRQTGMAISAIHEAGDGQEALTVLADHPVHLVLTDINMPKMDGLQLLASLKASAQWRTIPVVMITTEGGETKVAEAVRLGAADEAGLSAARVAFASNRGSAALYEIETDDGHVLQCAEPRSGRGLRAIGSRVGVGLVGDACTIVAD